MNRFTFTFEVKENDTVFVPKIIENLKKYIQCFVRKLAICSFEVSRTEASARQIIVKYESENNFNGLLGYILVMEYNELYGKIQTSENNWKSIELCLIH